MVGVMARKTSIMAHLMYSVPLMVDASRSVDVPRFAKVPSARL